MRTRLLAMLTVLGVCLVAAAADEPDKLAEQKKAAAANWMLLEAGEPVSAETTHLLLVAPPALEKRLKDIGALLEKQYDAAAKALQVDEKANTWWPGKLTVYLFTEREQFTAFVRRAEKRRLETDEVGCFAADGDLPHVAAAPPKAKSDPAVEVQAAQLVASAVLQRKAGAKVPLPEWVVAGFGRATLYRASPNLALVAADRQQAADLVRRKGRTAKDVWGGGLDAEEAVVLRGSVVDFLAYGPGSSKFASFVAAFMPEEGQEKKTAEQALDAVNLKPDTVDKNWQTWVSRPR